MGQFDQFAMTTNSLGGQGSNSQVAASLSPFAAANNMGELSSQYYNMGKNIAGITKPITDATNESLQQNLSMGGQAANNAGAEYAARQMQQGGSATGAGVVKAQTMMGVLGQNNQLKMQAANTVAGLQSQGLSMQAQMAQQMASLRQSYATALANYTTQSNAQAQSAAQFLLTNNKGAPSGQWTTNNFGQITSGADNYSAYQGYLGQQSQARNFLAGIA
jgi:hypothetical protein